MALLGKKICTQDLEKIANMVTLSILPLSLTMIIMIIILSTVFALRSARFKNGISSSVSDPVTNVVVVVATLLLLLLCRRQKFHGKSAESQEGGKT